VTASSDDRVDLEALRDDTAVRAARITARVMERVAQRRSLWDGVRQRLASLAVPVGLAAAASLAAILGSDRPAPTPPDPFAVAVMGRGPVTRWVALNERPDLAELIAVVGSEP
jgi:hypothetical protein